MDKLIKKFNTFVQLNSAVQNYKVELYNIVKKQTNHLYFEHLNDTDIDTKVKDTIHNTDTEVKVKDTNVDTKVKDTNPIECFTLFTKVDQMINYIDKSLSIIESIKFNLVEASDTTRIKFKSELIQLRSNFTKLINKFNLDDVAIIAELTAIISEQCIKEIQNKVSDSKTLDKIRKILYDTKQGVSLYASVMQELIVVFYKTNKNISFELLNYIEDDKSFILSDTLYDTLDNTLDHTRDNTQYVDKKELNKANNALKRVVKNNPPAHRFGLVPATLSDTLLNCITKVANIEGKPVPQGKTGTTLIKAAADTFEKGFIILNRIVNEPIEYNVKPLIFEEQAQQYLQPKTYGINKKIVDRYNTIIPHTNTGKWDFSTVVYNEDAAVFYILETIDGRLYRFMTPWLTSTTNFKVTKFRITNLLKYIANAGKVEKSRATNYHLLNEKVAAGNMFMKRALELESFEKQSSLVDTNDIKNNISTILTNYVVDLMKKKYKNKFTNSNEIISILHDENLIKQFSIAVVSYYKQSAVLDETSEFNAGEFDFSELLSSFMISLQTITRRFARELHNGYIRNPLPEGAFHLKNTYDIVHDKIILIINNAINLVIKLNENIYTEVQYKYLILNFA